jgi:RNA polymerase sigma-70 factor (ECF subfamily)
MQEDQDLSILITGCKKGDQAAFSRLVELYSGRCFGYFYRLTGNRELSNDMLSELFVKLVTKIGQYKGGAAFDFWLFKIASNIFHDHLRTLQRERKMLESQRQELEMEMAARKKPDDDMSDILQSQLGRLDEDTRELVTMRFYSQMSFKEIAEIRKEPIGTVLSKVHRGLGKLRNAMEGEYEKRK